MYCHLCNKKYVKNEFINLKNSKLCTHVICADCLYNTLDQKCPFCKIINDNNNNKGIEKKIAAFESENQTIRREINASLIEANHLRLIMIENYQKKIKENAAQFHFIRNLIINKTNEMINTINKSQQMIMSHVRKIETRANDDLNKLLVNNKLEKEINDAYILLKNNQTNQDQLESLNKNFKLKNTHLNYKLIEFEKTNDSKYIFYPNSKFKMNLELIGKISKYNTQLNQNNAIIRYIKSIETNKTTNRDTLLLEKGKLFEMKCDYDTALVFYTKASEINNKNDKAFYLIGKCYQFKKNYSLAIECFDKAIEINSNLSIYLILKGLALKERKEYGAAIECYNRAIQLDQKDPDSYFGKGLVLAARKNFSRAIIYYNKAIELVPNEKEYWNKKADALFCQSDYKGALSCLKKSICIDLAKNEYAYNLKGIIYFVQNKYDDAIECFKKSIEIGKTNANYYYNIGYAYFKKNEQKEANFNFNKAKELNKKTNFANYENNLKIILFKQ